MRFLALAPLSFALLGGALGGCTVTTNDTTATGRLEVHWTVAGSIDPNACSVNGATGARVDVLSPSGVKVNVGADSQRCDAFGVSFPGTFTVGTYTVNVTLLNADGSAATTVASGSVYVDSIGTAQAAFDFPTSSFTHVATTGKLEVYWTIGTSKDPSACSTNGVATARVDVLAGATKVNTGADTQTCTAFGTSFVQDFASGGYTVQVTLLDSSGAALTTTATASATVPTDGSATQVNVDFPESSFL